MSWNASAIGTRQELATGGIESAPTSPTLLNEPMAKQHAAARVIALQLIEQVPGPRLSVTMYGHANGVGEHAKPGWTNDCLGVVVTQVTE